MGRPDVRRMLSEISSQEYTRWLAYEKATGPLDESMDREVSAGIHELLQALTWAFGQANFTDKEGEGNPFPRPKQLPRGGDWLREQPDTAPVVSTLDAALEGGSAWKRRQAAESAFGEEE